MRCLNCGKDTHKYLCKNCRTEDVLAHTYQQIMYFKPDDEDIGLYIREFVEGYADPEDARKCLPDILDLFPASMAEFYRCMYCKVTKDPRFEELAIAYLKSHNFMDKHTQKVLYSLLSFYIPDDLIKPQKWCDRIKSTSGLAFDMYCEAADFYSKVGDYDIADQLIEQAQSLLNAPNYDNFLYIKRENASNKLSKLSASIQGYRTKKPYWPKTEARQRMIAELYDSKGIKHPRLDKPTIVKESDFQQLKEADHQKHDNYCTFWCADVFSPSGVKVVYQIAAVKVRDGHIVEKFQSFIKPWDGLKEKESAAKQAGVDLSVINGSEDVDLVMKRFFAFVSDNILVSTDALSNQAKCIARVARYSGMATIPNQFLDLLDYAADISDDFDMEHNTREYLLGYLGLTQGRDAMENAMHNAAIYERLKELDG